MILYFKTRIKDPSVKTQEDPDRNREEEGGGLYFQNLFIELKTKRRCRFERR